MSSKAHCVASALSAQSLSFLSTVRLCTLAPLDSRIGSGGHRRNWTRYSARRHSRNPSPPPLLWLFLNKIGKPKRRLEDPTIVAWKILTGAYYKDGGRPWQLANVRAPRVLCRCRLQAAGQQHR
jgi:hypothetical protein